MLSKAIGGILVAGILALGLGICFPGQTVLAQAAEPGLKIIKSGVTLLVTVEPEDFDGLTVSGPDKEVYLVLVPEEVSFEELTAFHAKYKNKQVSLSGDVLADPAGNFSLSVKSLPK